MPQFRIALSRRAEVEVPARHEIFNGPDYQAALALALDFFVRDAHGDEYEFDFENTKGAVAAAIRDGEGVLLGVPRDGCDRAEDYLKIAVWYNVGVFELGWGRSLDGTAKQTFMMANHYMRWQAWEPDADEVRDLMTWTKDELVQEIAKLRATR